MRTLNTLLILSSLLLSFPARADEDAACGEKLEGTQQVRRTLVEEYSITSPAIAEALHVQKVRYFYPEDRVVVDVLTTRFKFKPQSDATSLEWRQIEPDGSVPSFLDTVQTDCQALDRIFCASPKNQHALDNRRRLLNQVREYIRYTTSSYGPRRGWSEAYVAKAKRYGPRYAENSAYIDVQKADEQGNPVRGGRIGNLRLIVAPYGKAAVTDMTGEKLKTFRPGRFWWAAIPPYRKRGMTHFYGPFGNAYWDYFDTPEYRRVFYGSLEHVAPPLLLPKEDYLGELFPRNPEMRPTDDYTQEVDGEANVWTGFGIALELGNWRITKGSHGPAVLSKLLLHTQLLVKELKWVTSIGHYGDETSVRFYERYMGFKVQSREPIRKDGIDWYGLVIESVPFLDGMTVLINNLQNSRGWSGEEILEFNQLYQQVKEAEFSQPFPANKR